MSSSTLSAANGATSLRSGDEAVALAAVEAAVKAVAQAAHYGSDLFTEIERYARMSAAATGSMRAFCSEDVVAARLAEALGQVATTPQQRA
jgi:hypothetical protein